MIVAGLVFMVSTHMRILHKGSDKDLHVAETWHVLECPDACGSGTKENFGD
jgi:hypothetical protein